MTRAEASEIAVKLPAKDKGQAGEAPAAKSFEKCFYPHTARPLVWHTDLRKTVKDGVAGLVIKFRYWRVVPPP